MYVDIDVYKDIKAHSKHNNRMKSINSVQHYLHIIKNRLYLIDIHIGNKIFRK